MKAVLIDANLLALRVVGSEEPSLIIRNRNTKRYDFAAFEILDQVVSEFAAIVLTPGLLAETSNLISQMPAVDRPKVLARLRVLIDHCAELQVESKIAAHRAEFVRLGLVDAALLALCEDHRDSLTLLTHDGPLAAAAYSLHLAVIDFGGLL